tara:strand:+ start:554 stop:1312 length:759 start_codon:yes stop_codon:yes gene_type:complete
LIEKVLLNKVLLEWYLINGVENIVIPLEGRTNDNYKKIKLENSSNRENPLEINDKKLDSMLNGVENLNQLKDIINSNCDCSLKKTAKNMVFSDGNPKSNIMLIGESPGEAEDKTGKSFRGETGQLLDKMLNSISLNRKNTYLTNIIFWRPPGNRKPTEVEINSCLPFVEKHIELINPYILILVGATAAKSIYKIQSGITQIRGKWKNIQINKLKNLKSIAIFHPAFLIKQPSRKREAWEDLKKIKIEIDRYT